MRKSCTVRELVLRSWTLLAFVLFAGLFGSGHDCDGESDAAQIQQQALIKLDKRKETKRPDSVISKLPADSKFKGFSDSGSSQQAGPKPRSTTESVFGVFLEDLNFDNQSDGMYFLYALAADEAFVDLNHNGSFDAASEPHLLYTAFDHSMLWSDPRGGSTSPVGAYSLVLFREILDLKDPNFFGLTFPTTLYFDDPQGGQGTEAVLNKFMLFGAQVLPHVPFGTAGPYQITTQIVVNNPSSVESNIKLQFFSAEDGEVLPTRINGQTDWSHSLTIPADSSRLFEIEPPEEELLLAWAFVQGNPAVEASANFVTFPKGTTPSAEPTGIEKTILAEAGIAGTDTQIHHVLNVSKSPNGVSTSFAIVNPTGEDAEITVTLTKKSDAAPAGTSETGLKLATVAEDEQVAQKTISLKSMSQTAVFFDKLLEISDARFEGTVVLDSNTDIAVAVLKTFKGMQSASLPSGMFKIGRSR